LRASSQPLASLFRLRLKEHVIVDPNSNSFRMDRFVPEFAVPQLHPG
jgi:hypothetical protein